MIGRGSSSAAVLRILAAWLGVSICLSLVSAPIDHWTQRSPLPFGGDFLDVGFGNGKFIGVGYYGSLLTSTNGSVWQLQNTGTSGHLFDVATGNGLIVAAEIDGYNIVSKDGVSWSRFPSTLNIEGLGFANGLFLGGGYDGSTFGIISSPDGSNWTRRATISGNITQIIYGGGYYLASGYAGKIFVSTNLTDWTISSTGGDESHYGLCYANGLYMASGAYSGVFVSSDTVHWANVSVGTGGAWDVTYWKGAFIGVSGLRAIVSADGTNWAAFPIPAREDWMSYGWIAHSDDMLVTLGTEGIAASSPDGTNWTSHFHGTIKDLYGVCYGANQWMSVGDLQETVVSTNGIDWARQRGEVSGAFTSIYYTNGLFVAGDFENGYGSMFSSLDGKVWTEFHIPSDTPAFYAVSYGNGTWVSVGIAGVVWTSTTGTNWQAAVSGTPLALTGLVFAQNKFVAVGDKGIILTSPDGSAWSPANSASSAHLNSVTYGQGSFVGVGVSGTVLTSINGVDWEIQSPVTGETLTGVAYGAGYFVAVGSGGRILTSPDGNRWLKEASPVSCWLFNVSFGDHSFLAVGERGVMVQSDPFITLDLLSPHPPTLRIAGPAGRSVSIEAASDLRSTPWQSVATLPLGASPALWTDPLPPGPCPPLLSSVPGACSVLALIKFLYRGHQCDL